ncbi:hypothetical protein [Streptomyces sp. A13(2022)]|uniref:hypothetical protein n=1 Tax=Streptomyces sp. A13(2022) TaxID=2964768 RepID=UPI0021D7FEA9|nr:hypothetical protein [Streptomyces sp. A13(2022)]MCU8589353.1 hypothetical protein [Streptomyces sp. A13(2022)]
MSARTVIAHALRVYYQDDRDPAGFVERLLAQYDAEQRAAVLVEAAVEAEGAVSLFADSDEGAASAGAMEGIALRYRRMAGEKSIPADAQPVEDDATHRHPRPCEYPEVLPCCCVRPGRLPEASFLRARRRSLVGAFFEGVKHGHNERWLWAGEPG